MCQIIWLLMAIVVQQAISSDPLLKMGDNSECIKEVVGQFIKKETCHELDENQKANLAIKMTNCLNIKLGKPALQQCRNFKSCNIVGDDWSTFTTFYTHIDNLCHFYWDLLHHERTTKLIGDLSESAIHAESILNKNFQSTQKILNTQEIIQSFMNESMKNHIKLSETLESSENKLTNMTQSIEDFLQDLNQKLISQYASLINVMQVINEGVSAMSTAQSIMISEIYTISGLLYFIVQFLVFSALTLFKLFRKNRTTSFLIFLINIVFQLLCPGFIIAFVGIQIVRMVFVALHLGNLVRAFLNREQNSFENVKGYMDERLNTKRIKRIFKEIMEEQKMNQLKMSEIND